MALDFSKFTREAVNVALDHAVEKRGEDFVYDAKGLFPEDGDYSRSLREARESLMSQKEAYLLEFFGSMEVAKRRVKFYILEQYPTELEHSGDVYTVKEKVRLRLKTAEELLEENTSE